MGPTRAVPVVWSVAYLAIVAWMLKLFHAGQLEHASLCVGFVPLGFEYVVWACEAVTTRRPRMLTTLSTQVATMCGALAMVAIFVCFAPSRGAAVEAGLAGALGLVFALARSEASADRQVRDPQVWVFAIQALCEADAPNKALEAAARAACAGRLAECQPNRLLTDVIEKYRGTRLGDAAGLMLDEQKRD